MGQPTGSRGGAWPPHRQHTMPWRQRVVRGPGADRRMREITVNIPPTIAQVSIEPPPELAEMLRADVGRLIHLDLIHGRTMAALVPLQLRTEAIDSSKIEDVEASLADYGRALLGVGASAGALSMASATRALHAMILDAQRTRRVRAETMLTAHRELFRFEPDEWERSGVFRTRQNWVGGSDYSPRGALWVPPPPELVPELLEDLFAFANRDDLSPLLQAAIAHAQFESIHPFIDGNGRIGRALIHAILRRRRATKHLTVPIASALVAGREGYFAALGHYRRGDAWPIVELLAHACGIAVSESRRAAEGVQQVRDDWQALLGDRSGTPGYRLADLLTEEPIVTTELVAERLGIDAVEASALVDRFVGLRILTAAPRSRRHRVWLAPALLAEVEALSRRAREAGAKVAVVAG